MRSVSNSKLLRLLAVVVAVGVPLAALGDPFFRIRNHEGKVVLTWRVMFSGEYLVESSPTLSGGWGERSEPILAAGGLRQMTVDPVGGVEFFRLRNPVTSARVARGGALYDKWWKVTGASEPTSDHPLWVTRPDLSSNARRGADTWRCKECHGWDYKGVDGAYGSGSHRTGFPGIFGTEKSTQELFDLVKNGHGYGAAGLADDDILDLILFVQQGQVDTARVIDSEGKFLGDLPRGEQIYWSGIGSNTSCLHCHGSDGMNTPPNATFGYDAYPGLVSNENPWEFLHKVRFGHPGSDMPASEAAGGTLQEVADVSAYCQGLPLGP